ncbi:MAG: YitT family protein [Calditrichia bacterium]
MEDPKYTRKNFIRDIIYILIGTIILALALVFFLIPNKIAPGGVAGLSLIFHHLFGFPTGLVMIVLNFPMFVVGYKMLGRGFAIRTIVSMILFSFFTDFFAINLQLPALTDNIFLATLYGGLLVGVGLGFVFKGDSTAGGATILARILTERTRFKTGQILLLFDFMVISFAGIAFQNVELALWAFITIFIASQMVDLIITGKPFAKIVYIVTNQVEEIGEHIVRDLSRSATILSGEGLYTKVHKNIIMVVIDSSQISLLKDIVKLHDKDAFMIVMDAREVLGKGF